MRRIVKYFKRLGMSEKDRYLSKATNLSELEQLNRNWSEIEKIQSKQFFWRVF